MVTTPEGQPNAQPKSPSAAGVDGWPGRRLGLPPEGPRSIARPARRVAALMVDWALCSLVSYAFFDYDAWATLVIFAASQIIFIVTVAGSIGHLIFGMRLVPLAGGWIGLWRPVARTLMICIVIPAVIWDRDQRGMHDRLVGTVLVRR